MKTIKLAVLLLITLLYPTSTLYAGIVSMMFDSIMYGNVHVISNTEEHLVSVSRKNEDNMYHYDCIFYQLDGKLCKEQRYYFTSVHQYTDATFNRDSVVFTNNGSEELPAVLAWKRGESPREFSFSSLKDFSMGTEAVRHMNTKKGFLHSTLLFWHDGKVQNDARSGVVRGRTVDIHIVGDKAYMKNFNNGEILQEARFKMLEWTVLYKTSNCEAMLPERGGDIQNLTVHTHDCNLFAYATVCSEKKDMNRYEFILYKSSCNRLKLQQYISFHSSHQYDHVYLWEGGMALTNRKEGPPSVIVCTKDWDIWEFELLLIDKGKKHRSNDGECGDFGWCNHHCWGIDNCLTIQGQTIRFQYKNNEGRFSHGTYGFDLQTKKNAVTGCVRCFLGKL